METTTFKSQLEGAATASQQINSLGAVLHIVRQPSENMLAQMYLHLAYENQLEVVWHVKVPTLTEFLEATRRTDTFYYACLVESTDTGRVELAGIGWAADVVELSPKRYRSSSGMAFRKDFQSRHYTTEFCEMMIEDGFKMGVEAQYGYTPVPNRAACLFHRAMGFQVLAIAPSYSTWEGKSCDVQIAVITRERWGLREKHSTQEVGV